MGQGRSYHIHTGAARTVSTLSSVDMLAWHTNLSDSPAICELHGPNKLITDVHKLIFNKREAQLKSWPEKTQTWAKN